VWAKRVFDEWTTAAGIDGRTIFRRVSRLGKIWGDRITQLTGLRDRALIAVMIRDAELLELRTLRLARIQGRSMWSESANNKFLKNISGCASANPDERIFKGQSRPVAILVGIVKIGDTSRG
jgi:hypothetical protein